MKAFLHKTKKCISVSVITSQPSAAQLLKIIVVWFFSSIFLLKQKPLSSCSFYLMLWVPSLFSFWSPLTSYSNLIHICIGTFLQSFMKLLVAFLLFMRFFLLVCLFVLLIVSLRIRSTPCSTAFFSFLEPYSCSSMNWCHPHSWHSWSHSLFPNSCIFLVLLCCSTDGGHAQINSQEMCTASKLSLRMSNNVFILPSRAI